MSVVDVRPLIAHVVHRFDVGGLENGVVNLLNRMPVEQYRHAVISLTDVTSFRRRVLRDDVEFIEMHKTPGHGVKLFPRLFRLFWRLNPAIVHTRNLAALEACAPAWMARTSVRVHGEHGRDVDDLDGSNRAYRLVRRVYRPFINHYIAVSRDLERYLLDTIGVRRVHVTRIVNGVDTQSFTPLVARAPVSGCPFVDPGLWLCGTVGRLQPVKNQALLARAFVRALEQVPALRSRLRLIVVGDGPVRADVVDVLSRAGVLDLAWLPGARNDVADVLRSLDVFVLPSLAEGISNTILEAMASGLPVIATDVGGNGELVEDPRTGALIAANDTNALADALIAYACNPDLARAAGRAGRARVEQLYSLDAMVAQYGALYDRLLRGWQGRAEPVASQAATRATSGSD